MALTIFFDRDRCIGCYSCTVACKLEHHLPPFPVRPPVSSPQGPELIRVREFGPHIRGEEVHQYFQPILCIHCPEAPCIDACPTSAIYRDVETGITLVDKDECTGCESCLSVCPYEAPQFYDGKLFLCDLCIHRLGDVRADRRYAACQAACPARAIHIGVTEEIPSTAAKRAAKRAGKAEQDLNHASL